MANPLPPDNRAYGSLFRSREVMKVPIQYLIPYPDGYPNPHDNLTQDILCSTCGTRGNVKNIDPLNLGDGTIKDAPEVGRSYLWDYPTLQRNHRCSLCRLVWKTFQPFFEKLDQSRPPVAVLGRHCSLEQGRSRWIEMISMAYKDTLDNKDMRGSGEVYIYEDERIPHFNITQRATDPALTNAKSPQTEWRQTKIVRNDQIDFSSVESWINECKTGHGSKCNEQNKHKSPARRLLDVEKRCIVDGSKIEEYLTLSYVWGMAAQFMLTRDVIEESTKEGFFESIGTKIPQSIQDAMQVCRNIGVRHLWVDALCIIQDDENDKSDQIRLMDEIYGCALAVLIVAAGDDANYGIPGMGTRKRALATSVEIVDGKVLTTSFATTTFSAKRSLWNTRAWTYQEYILGNRLLVFTETYVFFKCAQAMFRDDAVLPATGPFPSMPIQSDDKWLTFTLKAVTENLDTKKVWKDYYDTLLTFYLRRDMKFGSDALPAFSGILKVLSGTLGPFHFGLPSKFFGRSLLWTDPHHSVFKRRADFPSWSWAGWQWSFDYFDAEQSSVGAYGYKMPEESVPIQFFILNDHGSLTPFFREKPEEGAKSTSVRTRTNEMMDFLMMANQQTLAEPHLSFEEHQMKMIGEMLKDQNLRKSEQTEESLAEEREQTSQLMSQLEPPATYQYVQLKNSITEHKQSGHFLAFYTSVATLKVSYTTQNVQAGQSVQYEVHSRTGDKLFTCYLDPVWRNKQPECLEFVVIGLKENGKAIALMLLEEIDGIHYRVNWAWKLSQHLLIRAWMEQHPIQKLIIWG